MRKTITYQGQIRVFLRNVPKIHQVLEIDNETNIEFKFTTSGIRRGNIFCSPEKQKEENAGKLRFQVIDTNVLQLLHHVCRQNSQQSQPPRQSYDCFYWQQ